MVHSPSLRLKRLFAVAAAQWHLNFILCRGWLVRGVCPISGCRKLLAVVSCFFGRILSLYRHVWQNQSHTEVVWKTVQGCFISWEKNHKSIMQWSCVEAAVCSCATVFCCGVCCSLVYFPQPKIVYHIPEVRTQYRLPTVIAMSKGGRYTRMSYSRRSSGK